MVLLMLITGVFWGTWFTLTRSIGEFSSAEFIHIGKVIIANVANPMKILMPAGILFLGWTTWTEYHKKRRTFQKMSARRKIRKKSVFIFHLFQTCQLLEASKQVRSGQPLLSTTNLYS